MSAGEIQVGKLVAGLKMDTSEFASGITNAAGALDGFKKTINSVKTALTTMLANPVVLAAAAISALVAAAGAAWDAWKEFDAAYDAIAVGTGATEQTLEELKDSFDKVFKDATYVESKDALAATIADLNTYLGVTGDELEHLATQFSNLEGMGVSASVDSFAQALNKWNIEASDAGQYLDYFFKVSQDTGVSIDSLASSLANNKATLDLFGFSLEEATSLIGAMNKAGYDSSTLQTGLRQLAAQGITTREEFDALVRSIKNTSDQTRAVTIATEAFGARAGTEMAALIRSGLLDNIGGGFDKISGHINQTADATADFDQRMDKIGRGVQEAFAEAGGFVEAFLMKLFDIFEWVDGLRETFYAPIVRLFERIGESFAKFWNEGENNAGDAISNITGFIEQLVENLAAGVEFFLEFIYPAIEEGISLIVDVIKLFCAMFADDWETVWDKIQTISKKVVLTLYRILEAGWNFIAEGVEGFLQWIVDVIIIVINGVLKFIEDSVNKLLDMINKIIGAANRIFGLHLDMFGHVKLELEVPDIEIPKFDSTSIGKGLIAYIESDNKSLEESGFTQNNTIIVNGDVTDPYTMSKEVWKQARDLAGVTYL